MSLMTALVSLFILSGSLFASEVVRISPSGRYLIVSPEVEPSFKVGDYACVIEEKTEIACGYISVSTNRGSVLYLERKNPRVDLGAEVNHATLDRPNASFSELREGGDIEESIPMYQALFGHGGEVKETERVPKYNLLAEVNFTNPSVMLETVLDTKWTWGLQLSLNQFSSLNMNVPQPISGTLVGLLGTFNYYHQENFRGLWIRTGAGYYAGKVTYKTSSDNPGTLSAIATVGYRWVKRNMNYGISGGLQYFNIIKTNIFPYNVHLVTPIVALNMGWVF